MAERVTIEGQTYLKRNPLGVLGLVLIHARDLRLLLVLVPPFIAYYNTANHVVDMEQRRGIPSQISPALVVILGLVIWIGMAAYVQEHLNRVWDPAATQGAAAAPPPPPAPADALGE
ncbi:MAG: hypothetical protein L0206_24850 [Actinobacteria bacterium]|nr:hypothetical protein [Actinomycetota bacterium]